MNDEFGVFAPLFRESAGYLVLLNLNDASESKCAVSLVKKCCESVPDATGDICRFLQELNWRPHLVGAVAVALLPHNPKTIQQLWSAIDADSWVTPQLAAVAFLRDPKFTRRAGERLGFRRSLRRDDDEDSSEGQDGLTSCHAPLLKSGKAVASLKRLMELLPQSPDWFVSGTLPSELRQLLNDDRNLPGEYVEEWLRRLRRNLSEV